LIAPLPITLTLAPSALMCRMLVRMLLCSRRTASSRILVRGIWAVLRRIMCRRRRVRRDRRRCGRWASWGAFCWCSFFCNETWKERYDRPIELRLEGIHRGVLGVILGVECGGACKLFGMRRIMPLDIFLFFRRSSINDNLESYSG
jgi:hypothetical protein